MVAEADEQTNPTALQDDELGFLQRGAEAARIADDLVRSANDVGGCTVMQARSSAGLRQTTGFVASLGDGEWHASCGAHTSMAPPSAVFDHLLHGREDRGGGGRGRPCVGQVMTSSSRLMSPLVQWATARRTGKTPAPGRGIHRFDHRAANRHRCISVRMDWHRMFRTGACREFFSPGSRSASCA